MAVQAKEAAHIVRRQVMDRPDGYGINSGECGDTVEIFLKARDDKIQKVHFEIDGCTATRLCALVVAELITGAGIDRAWHIRPDHIIAALPELPRDHHHCAELAAGALYRALTDLRNNTQRPWAALYRTQRHSR